MRAEPESGRPSRVRLQSEDIAGRQSRIIWLKALSITGQNSRMIASVVIEPTRAFDQNTLTLPPEPIIDRLKASSARLPSTSANVNAPAEC